MKDAWQARSVMREEGARATDEPWTCSHTDSKGRIRQRVRFWESGGLRGLGTAMATNGHARAS